MLKKNNLLIEGFELLVRKFLEPDLYLDIADEKIYSDIRTMFRYPGELLERYKEQGYVSLDDSYSVFYAYAKCKDLLTPEMFTQSQESLFIKDMSSLCSGRYAAYFLYLLCMTTENTVFFMGQLQKELSILDDSSALDLLCEFLLFCKCRQHRFTFSWDLKIVISLLNTRPDIPVKIHKILPICERTLEKYYFLCYFSAQFSKALYPELSIEWKSFIQAFQKLFEIHIKEGTTAEKKLMEYGYSRLEILDLNCGIHECVLTSYPSIGYKKPGIKNDSYIKYYRLKKDWIHTNFLSEEEIPLWKQKIIAKCCKPMERKIDGKDNEIDFFFESLVNKELYNQKNSFFFFLSYNRCSNKNGQFDFFLRSDYTGTHSFLFSKQPKLEFLKNLLDYIEKCEHGILMNETIIKNIKYFILREAIKKENQNGTSDMLKHADTFKELSGTTIEDFLLDEDYISNNTFVILDLMDIGYIPYDPEMNSYVKKEFFRSCASVYAYEAMKKEWNNVLALNNYQKISDFPTPLWIQKLENHFCSDTAGKSIPDVFNHEQLKTIVNITLEKIFMTDPAIEYEKCLAWLLCVKRTRELFLPADARKIYQMLIASNSIRIYHHYLHDAFLTKEDIERMEKEKEAKRLQEEEAKKLQRIEEKRKHYLLHVYANDTPEEQCRMLIKNAISNRYELDYKLFFSIFEEYLQKLQSQKIHINFYDFREFLNILFSYYQKQFIRYDKLLWFMNCFEDPVF